MTNKETMKKQDLINIILDIPEETQTTEFKRLDGKKVVAKVVETIVAMANTDGGQIIIGVDDPEKTAKKGLHRIYGIEENKDLYDEIVREVQRIVPPLSGLTNPVLLEADNKKTIALIFVNKATDSFHTIDNHVYVRLHKGNKRLTPQEVVKMNYAKGFEKADKELVDVDFSLLQTPQYKAWKTNRSIAGDDIREVCFKTGLARRSKGKLKPTRAAVLLFADYPTNLMDTKCTIRITQWTGRLEKYRETPNLIGSPKTIEGPMIPLIAGAHEYVLTLLRAGIEIHSGFITRYRIPERAVKEAITNAVIHRDYHIKRDIEVKIFEDRIEVISPGLLPYNITKNNIGRVRSDGYRNDLLVKHLREFPEPPNLDQNEGVKAMQNEMYSNNLYPPVFLTYPLYDDSVCVLLSNEHRPSEWEKVKDYLIEHRYINNSQARDITGTIQVYTMYEMLKKWVKQGLLIKVQPKNGAKRNTRYKLSNQEDINRQQ